MGLDLIKLVMDVEDHFGVSIPIDDQEHLRTVQDLSDLVIRELERDERVVLEEGRRERILLGICQMISEQKRLPIAEVRPESDLIRDLGMG